MKRQGFGVLTQIDVKATLAKKLDAGFRKCEILGTCNPPLAYQALSTELEIGLLLPCDVIVFEKDGGWSVESILDPVSMLGVVESADLAPVAEAAEGLPQRVIKALSSTS